MSFESVDPNVSRNVASRQVCCSNTLSDHPVYKCPSGNHCTCQLHLYMDARQRPHCYTCMVELDEDVTIEPMVYRRARAATEASAAVIVIHALHMCGTARHCLELAQEFSSRGLAVTVLTVGGGGHWAHRFLSVADTLIVASPSADWDTFQGVLSDGPIAFVTAHHDPAISWALENIPPSIPLFAHFHVEPSADKVTAELLKAATRRCTKIFFPSECTMQQYRFLLGIDSDDKLAVLHNGLPHNVLPTPARWHWPHLFDWLRPQRVKPRPHLAIISRLDDDKFSAPLFLQVIGSVTTALPNVNISVAGTGESALTIRQATEDAGLSQWVRFLGFVDDIGSLYGSADAVFVPSYTEAMPYTALESAAFQTPCIVPRVGYFSEDTSEVSYVHVFEPGDHAAAASIIVRALTTKDRREAGNASNESSSHAAWSETVHSAYALRSL